MTLFGDFLKNDHRRSHKWYQYFPVYERHFERFRNRHITLFEIGLGEGGSLQQWRGYFGPFAQIVGIDIEPICKQLEDEQIQIRIGSQDDTAFLKQVLAEFGDPDVVIDDGSHIQQHVNASFEVLYPRVAKNGVYLVEDLHAAYWPSHGAGLGHAESFIERAKRYVDDIHAEYTGDELPRSALGDRTASIHFYDSVVVLEVGEYRPKRHRLTGDASLFRSDWTPQSATSIAGPESQARGREHAAELAQLRQEVGALREQLGGAARRGLQAKPLETDTTEICAARGRIQSLESEVRALRASRSWRMTGPLRAIRAAFRWSVPSHDGQS